MFAILAAIMAAATTAELPPLADCDRFPPVAWCEQQQKMASAHLAVFEANRNWEPHRAAFWDEAISQTKGTLAAYDALSWARYDSQYYCVQYRREHLAQLRGAIGQSNYDQGSMPLPVPLWALRRLD